MIISKEELRQMDQAMESIITEARNKAIQQKEQLYQPEPEKETAGRISVKISIDTEELIEATEKLRILGQLLLKINEQAEQLKANVTEITNRESTTFQEAEHS